jgi:hypothetical protein
MTAGLAERAATLFECWLLDVEVGLTANHVGLAAGLLHDMRQLMRQQSSPLASPRIELTRTKHEAVSDRVGASVYIPRRLFRNWTGMHADARKVAAKALFHLTLYRRVEWFAGADEGLIHPGRGRRSFSDRLRTTR